ncbi:hypothetical protein D3C87_1726590 [compost metagenome]
MFNHGAKADTGIVDENINSSPDRAHIIYHSIYLGHIRDIEFSNKQAVIFFEALLQKLKGGGTRCQNQTIERRACKMCRKGQAQTGAASCDKDDLHGNLLS